MSKQIHVFVACGSGVATSTVAAERIKEICKREKIDAKINKGSIQDIPMAAHNYDVILTVSNYREELEIPQMSVLAFISGIREKETEENLIKLLRKCAEA